MANAVATHEDRPFAERAWNFELGGSLTEASTGAAAIVLAILGLLRIAPAELVSIATILIGTSFLFLGGMLASRYARFSRVELPVEREVISEGMAMEALCGLTGVVLGVIALMSSYPLTLVSVAAIVFGIGLLVASGTTAQLRRVGLRELRRAESEPSGTYTPEPAYVASGPGILIALGGVVLGILAVAGFDPLMLTLVAMLGFGVAVLLSGTSFSTTMLTLFGR
jgi:hypothetical protein